MTRRYTIEVTASVRRQINDIQRYIAGEGAPLAAARMADRIVEAIGGLVEMPERGRPTRGRHRELIVSPYAIRYRVDRDTIYITSIRHAARRPD